MCESCFRAVHFSGDGNRVVRKSMPHEHGMYQVTVQYIQNRLTSILQREHCITAWYSPPESSAIQRPLC